MLLSAGCIDKEGMKLSITKRHTLDKISAASGIVMLNHDYFIIADNSPWLFRLNEQYQITEKIPVASLEHLTGDHIPKEYKSDFEALTLFNHGQEMLLFGSGSKSPERDTVVSIALKDGQIAAIERFTLGKLYAQLKAETGLKDSELNIEAAVTIGKELYLFNRGVNLIIKYDLTAFLHSVKQEKGHLQPQVYEIKLPVINGLEAGFSGASYLLDQQSIVFTASVENTENWIDDGPVLGSFIGVIEPEALGTLSEPACVILAQNGRPLPVKVESVAVREAMTPNLFDLLMVTDSDGGHSELIEASLDLNKPGNDASVQKN